MTKTLIRIGILLCLSLIWLHMVGSSINQKVKYQTRYVTEYVDLYVINVGDLYTVTPLRHGLEVKEISIGYTCSNTVWESTITTNAMWRVELWRRLGSPPMDTDSSMRPVP